MNLQNYKTEATCFANILWRLCGSISLPVNVPDITNKFGSITLAITYLKHYYVCGVWDN